MRELPEGWTLGTVGDTGRYINGLAFKPADWSERGRPIIRIQNLSGSSDHFNRTERAVAEDFLVHAGDILVSWSATLDAFRWNGPEAVLNQHIFKVVPDHRVDPTFLFHGLRVVIREMSDSEHTHGATMQHINRGPFLAHPFPLPPLGAQRRIAAKLDALQSKSRRAKEALDAIPPLLERFRQSVLAAAFRGDLTADWRAKNPDVEPASELLKRIRIERRRRWEEAELAKLRAKGKPPADDRWKGKYVEPEPVDPEGLPELPEEWVWARLGEAFEVGVGATPSRSEPSYWDGDIPWVSSGEVAFCRIRTTRESITQAGLSNSSTKMHPAGTVLLGMIGEGKTRGQAAILDTAACTNQNSAAIRVAATQLPPEYVYHYLEYQYERTRTAGSGNNQQALNKSRVEAIRIPLAPLAEQRELQQRTDNLLTTADRLLMSLEKITACGESLDLAALAKAFRGELVPQDPHDGPAHDLAAHTDTERNGRPQPNARIGAGRVGTFALPRPTRGAAKV